MTQHKVIVAVLITAVLVALGAWAGHAFSNKHDSDGEKSMHSIIGAVVGFIIGLLILWLMVKGNPLKQWAFKRKWDEGVRASKNM